MGQTKTSAEKRPGTAGRLMDGAEDLLVDDGLGAPGRRGGLLIGCGRGAQSRGGGPPSRRRTKDTGAAWEIGTDWIDRTKISEGPTDESTISSLLTKPGTHGRTGRDGLFDVRK
jgi:hypothetical protein